MQENQMTLQKAIVGNEFCGIFLRNGSNPDINGFAIYFFIFMLSCTTIDFEDSKLQNISLGVFGITFDFAIGHPWMKKNINKNCNKKR